MVAMQGSFSNPNMMTNALERNILHERNVNDTEPKCDAYEQEQISHREMEFKRCERLADGMPVIHRGAACGQEWARYEHEST